MCTKPGFVRAQVVYDFSEYGIDFNLISCKPLLYFFKVMPDKSFDDDVQLVKQLAGGNEEAFKKLYLKYIDRIHNFVLSICKSPELSMDVCHDIFMKVWKAREELDATTSFKSFLFTIAKNHVLNIIKRASKRREIHDEIISYVPVSQKWIVEDEMLYSEMNELLNKAIENLPPQRKKIYKLSRLEGLTHSKIAEKLGISKGTVNVQLVKALNSIKTFLIANGYNLISLLLVIFFN
ncbi:MAG: RNA polymerase sigma-70 factor [Cytophagales bacterium]|nr:RNA polymerase sigma-70 factor [Cytophagales bacterium]